jgi:hypothetical protein
MEYANMHAFRGNGARVGCAPSSSCDFEQMHVGEYKNGIFLELAYFVNCSLLRLFCSAAGWLYFAPGQFWVALGFLSPPSHGLT